MSDGLWEPAKKLLQHIKTKPRILMTDNNKQRFRGFIREIKQTEQTDVIKLSTVNDFGIYLPPSPNDSRLGNDSWFEHEYNGFPTLDKLTRSINGDSISLYTPSSMTI